MYFDKKQVNYMEAASWSKSQSCTYTLVFSSLSYGLIFGLYMFVYSGFVPFAWECNINCVSKECVRFLTHTVFYLIE